jgi:uncharacterized protein (TIGR00159 family)
MTMDPLLTPPAGIRWQDILDIALNSYVLFRLYVLFRGTNAFRVLVGIALLWFFQRIAVSVGLIVTSWAAQGIIAVGAIIIIIVFRDEIHSVLQAKKLKAVLWGFPQKVIPTPPSIVVESVFELSRRRTGALFVLPGKEDLKDLMQGGISWHGLLSKEMLLSIFWHDNPVHDGAAVIVGEHIERVGVILPLSTKKDMPSHQGTRHRAALGLAEASDAVVIVVSEENGSIHWAQDGRLEILRREEELERRLWNRAGARVGLDATKNRASVRLVIAALFSVLFVTGVWFSFSRGLESLTTLEVPIEYMNRDTAMEIMETSQNTVRVHLSGSGALIRSVGPDRLQVRLDLSKAKIGNNRYVITPDNISLPPGVYLKKIEQPSVSVTLDVPTKKELPIQVRWDGRLPANLILEEATLNPEKVQVIGGARILENVSTIYTETVSLEKLTQPGTLTVNLLLNPPSLKLAPGYKDSVSVTYTVKKRK